MKLSALAIFIPSVFLLLSCGDRPTTFTVAERRMVDSTVRAVRDLDSLTSLQKRLESEGNRLGSIVALREKGKECA